MSVVTRRGLLRAGAVLAGAAAGIAADGLWVEPAWQLLVTEYQVRPPRWPAGLKLRVALVADLHAGAPHMPIERVAAIVERTNALQPDLVLLLGDYRADFPYVTRRIDPAESLPQLARITAPLGCYGILGNHDYWYGVEAFRSAFADVGVPLLENAVKAIPTPAGPVYLAGTMSMIGRLHGPWRYSGLDDLPGTLARVPDGAPVILAAHEPDLFPTVPDRVSLTVSGHTHGGQVRLLGYSPHVPSHYGNRYAYGHVIEGGRNLVVSGGLGMSIFPVRLGVPPEIVLITMA